MIRYVYFITKRNYAVNEGVKYKLGLKAMLSKYVYIHLLRKYMKKYPWEIFRIKIVWKTIFMNELINQERLYFSFCLGWISSVLRRLHRSWSLVHHSPSTKGE